MLCVILKFYSKMFLSKNIFINSIYVATISLFNFNYLHLNASEYKKDIKPLNNMVTRIEEKICHIFWVKEMN